MGGHEADGKHDFLLRYRDCDCRLTVQVFFLGANVVFYDAVYLPSYPCSVMSSCSRIALYGVSFNNVSINSLYGSNMDCFGLPLYTGFSSASVYFLAVLGSILPYFLYTNKLTPVSLSAISDVKELII